MPAWLRNLHVEARHHWHVLRRHVPYYDNWRARRGLRQRLERMPKPLKPREAHQNLSSVAIDTSSSPHPQCLLLSRLPPELRLQIYEEVFKDDSYKQPSHLTTIKGRLAALPMCADCDCKNHDEVRSFNAYVSIWIYILTRLIGSALATSLPTKDMSPNLH